MAKKAYVGVNNVARKVSKMYVGVNGVARKVKKAYVGVNGVAREFYTILPKIVTWAGGTDAEIVAMVEAADNGLINLADYWSVGDTRSVSLSSMQVSPDIDESHLAQNVELVLSQVGGKTLTNATPSGRRTCSFQVDLKNSLNESGKISSIPTTYLKWIDSGRFTWCNTTFKDAMPNTLVPIFKNFVNDTVNYTQSVDTSYDYFSLRAEIDIFGSCTFSYPGEGSQVQYYNTASNRYKRVNGSIERYFLRSQANATNEAYNCTVGEDAQPHWNGGGSNKGIAPFGVI